MQKTYLNSEFARLSRLCRPVAHHRVGAIAIRREVVVQPADAEHVLIGGREAAQAKHPARCRHALMQPDEFADEPAAEKLDVVHLQDDAVTKALLELVPDHLG